MGVPKFLSLIDYLEIQNLAFVWAESYDAKDWDLLKTILSPAIRLDFRALQGPLQENLTPDQFAAVINDPKVIGDPRVKTQHLLGGCFWDDPGDGAVEVKWQLRVAHERFATEEMVTAINSGHAHGGNVHTYKKVDGAWKISGISAWVRWVEGDLFGTLNPPEGA